MSLETVLSPSNLSRCIIMHWTNWTNICPLVFWMLVCAWFNFKLEKPLNFLKIFEKSKRKWRQDCNVWFGLDWSCRATLFGNGEKIISQFCILCGREITYICSWSIAKRVYFIETISWAEFGKRNDVSVGYRRWRNADSCARMWPSRNLLLLHLYISLWSIKSI